MIDELPQGWGAVRPLEVATLIRGVSYQKGEAATTMTRGRVPLLRANNIDDGDLIFEDLQYVPEKRVSQEQRLRAGDVVVAMSSGSKAVVGKAGTLLQNWDGTFGAFCGVLRPSPGLEPKFFGLFFKTREYRQTISELSAGTNINNLKREYFDELTLPVPPLAEQRRIVAKVEALFAEVNTSRERLANVSSVLKRFRQSILAAACSSGESVSLGEILESVTYGTARKCLPDVSGTPVLRIPNIAKGVIDKDDLKFAKLDRQERDQLALREGDLLMVRSNGSVSLVGRTALVSAADTGFAFAGYLLRLRFDERRALPSYVSLTLRTYEVRGQIEIPARSTSGVHNINAEEVRNLRIQLPSLNGQGDVVRRVETLFALAESIEKQVTEATSRATKLTQSILAKAFRGELVATEAELARQEGLDYEPASVLVERIREQHGRQGEESRRVARAAAAIDGRKGRGHRGGRRYHR